ncbi:MAG: hypothetical protein HQM07_04420 [Zetaproteobacteria bacterium]|nr:hypothetical protein [Zetaproteobacteria bacterium]
MKKTLLLCALCAFAAPSFAENFLTTEEKAAHINEQLHGNNSYEAHLARALAKVAIEERGQNDMETAISFMKMAEDNAALALGGGK